MELIKRRFSGRCGKKPDKTNSHDKQSDFPVQAARGKVARRQITIVHSAFQVAAPQRRQMRRCGAARVLPSLGRKE
jgi:hypothetical protein